MSTGHELNYLETAVWQVVAQRSEYYYHEV